MEISCGKLLYQGMGAATYKVTNLISGKTLAMSFSDMAISRHAH
jgi:hypothetical protein